MFAETLFSTGRSAWSCGISPIDVPLKECWADSSKFKELQNRNYNLNTLEQDSWAKLYQEQLQKIHEIVARRPLGSLLKSV